MPVAQYIETYARLGINDPLVSRSIIEKWRQACDRTHLECQSTSSGWIARLPTRALDIQAPQKFRLDENGTAKARGWYAHLGYCWGGVVPLRTVSSSVQTFRENSVA